MNRLERLLHDLVQATRLQDGKEIDECVQTILDEYSPTLKPMTTKELQAQYNEDYSRPKYTERRGQ